MLTQTAAIDIISLCLLDTWIDKQGKIVKKLILLTMLTTLFACAATTEQLVQQGDWYTIGYQDGIRGNNQRSINQLSKLGSTKHSDYEQGYMVGLEEFCNPNHAYQIGLTGQHYDGVCEGTEGAQKFRMEWQRGWNEYSN